MYYYIFAVMCNMKIYLKGCISCMFIIVKLKVVHNDLWVNVLVLAAK